MATFAEEKYFPEEKYDEKTSENVAVGTPRLIRNLSENHWLVAAQIARRHPPRSQFVGRSGAWEYILVPGEVENEDVRVTLYEGVTVSSVRQR